MGPILFFIDTNGYYAGMIELLKLMYPYLRPYLRFAILASLCSIPLAAIKAYQAYFV